MRTAITRTVLLVDVSSATKTLEELKLQIRSQHFESALIRVSDLHAQLTQLQGLRGGATEPDMVDFRDGLTQLAILRELLERRLRDKRVEVDTVLANTSLSAISDGLHAWIGVNKYIGNHEDTP